MLIYNYRKPQRMIDQIEQEDLTKGLSSFVVSSLSLCHVYVVFSYLKRKIAQVFWDVITKNGRSDSIENYRCSIKDNFFKFQSVWIIN